MFSWNLIAIGYLALPKTVHVADFVANGVFFIRVGLTLIFKATANLSLIASAKWLPESMRVNMLRMANGS